MARFSRPWQTIKWARPPRVAATAAPATAAWSAAAPATAAPPIPTTQTSLAAAIRDLGTPHVPQTSAEEEAQILLSAGAEVEHALLVQYLYAAWSLGGNPMAPRVLEIAIQEMCHFVTVQNLLLFAGGSPLLARQDQDPNPALDPFRFTLRPLTKAVLEDFLLAEMPPLSDMTKNQRAVMEDVIKRHGGLSASVHPVGLIYMRLYWLFQENDEPTAVWPEIAALGFPPGRHIQTFPGQNTAATFQVDPAVERHWNAQHDRGGIFRRIDSRAAALDAIAAIAAQGEGLASNPALPSHFETFLDIYINSDLSQLSLSPVPTDPFVSDEPATTPAREANRITHKLAAALCETFDVRYHIMLTSIRAALSRDRSNAADVPDRDKYAGWALQEMLQHIKALARNILRQPCKDGGTAAQLTAAPTFALGDFDLPDDPAGLDDKLRDLHRSAASAITHALEQNPDAGTTLMLEQMQATDRTRFPNL